MKEFQYVLFMISAEQFLESVEGNQNYGLLLLTLLDRDGVEPHIRVSSAVTFKNFIRRNWRVVSSFFLWFQDKYKHVKLWQVYINPLVVIVHYDMFSFRLTQTKFMTMIETQSNSRLLDWCWKVLNKSKNR